MAQPAALDPLAELFRAGVHFTKSLQPDWQPQALLPPSARTFDDGYELLLAIVPGDHIAVSGGNYWHHGIYVGKQEATGRAMVVEVLWGNSKDESRVTWRPFQRFVEGGTRFALIEYPERAALSHAHSLALALHLVGGLRPPTTPRTTPSQLSRGGCRGVMPPYGEHFASVCRSLMCEQGPAVAARLDALPAHEQARPTKRGFK